MVKYNSSTGAKEIYGGIISILIVAPCKCICGEIAFSLCPTELKRLFDSREGSGYYVFLWKTECSRQSRLYSHPM